MNNIMRIWHKVFYNLDLPQKYYMHRTLPSLLLLYICISVRYYGPRRAILSLIYMIGCTYKRSLFSVYSLPLSKLIRTEQINFYEYKFQFIHKYQIPPYAIHRKNNWAKYKKLKIFVQCILMQWWEYLITTYW